MDNIVTKFGSYLQTQYGLLARTLSFMEVRELLNAAKVCRAWERAAYCLLKKREKNNKFRWHIGCLKEPCTYTNCCLHNRDFSMYPSSHVIAFMSNKSTKYKSNKYKSTNSLDKLLKSQSKDNDFAIFLPKARNYAIDCSYSTENVEDLPSFLNSVDTERDGKHLKGILMFTTYYLDDCTLTTPTFAFAGGLVPSLKQMFTPGVDKKISSLRLMFYGDINCYSRILSVKYNDKAGVEQFFKNMKDDVGVASKNQQQMAFIIRCIARQSKFEREMYERYFPNTPSFEITSEGELGCNVVNTNNDDGEQPDDPKRQKLGVPLVHQYCTIFFFITASFAIV